MPKSPENRCAKRSFTTCETDRPILLLDLWRGKLTAPTVATNGRLVAAIFATGELVWQAMRNEMSWSSPILVENNRTNGIDSDRQQVRLQLRRENGQRTMARQLLDAEPRNPTSCVIASCVIVSCNVRSSRNALVEKAELIGQEKDLGELPPSVFQSERVVCLPIRTEEPFCNLPFLG